MFRVAERAVPELPESIQQLDPELVRRWTISDDVHRQRALQAASEVDLRHLIEQINQSVLVDIDTYLNQFAANEPEPVVWLHDLAQAALEARMQLEERRPHRA
jgi:hypothetical protein